MSRSTRLLPVDPLEIGQIILRDSSESILDGWDLQLCESQDARHVVEAAQALKDGDVPVAFPTETVYGLGADATRSAAVRGIYKAKQRPSDNPLIVHICSLEQLRKLLRPPRETAGQTSWERGTEDMTNGASTDSSLREGAIVVDPIPAIYKPLIRSFWPGPLTLIMPKPPNSVLAREVTGGLNTFGARMPRNLLALALIKLAGVPIAAPSANASSKPSPTAADHVLQDLDGRIDIILDGGPCDVGVESTVVDGLSDPPAILRPGGISIDQLRTCPGWEHTVVAYKERSEDGFKPKAPGMKYRHYSPKASVMLYESGTAQPTLSDMLRKVSNPGAIGIVTTKRWGLSAMRGHQLYNSETSSRDDRDCSKSSSEELQVGNGTVDHPVKNSTPSATPSGLNSLHRLHGLTQHDSLLPQKITTVFDSDRDVEIWVVKLGADVERIARGLFSALRDLDLKQVQAIFVEGIDESEGDLAAAVMNRLRKAAEVKIELH